MDVEVDPDKTNPFEPTTGGDEDGESIPMPSTSSRRGSEDITNPFHHRTHGETSFIDGIDDRTPLIRERREKAWDVVERLFPNASATLITDYGKDVKLQVQFSEAKKPYNLYTKERATGKERINPKLPEEIKAKLGKTAEEITKSNNEKISKHSERVKELKSTRETAPENQRENLDQEMNEIDDLERENEDIEQRASLRERIKAIFKKYGFTLVAVLTAVGTVIGVIVSSLKSGLTTLGKGVGNGLKSIGKKLGEILPGLVGAIASFIFKTAGEVIGFLGKNAWLLIVGVVLYFIEQTKKRR